MGVTADGVVVAVLTYEIQYDWQGCGVVWDPGNACILEPAEDECGRADNLGCPGFTNL